MITAAEEVSGVGSAPVERLGSGGQFSGYQYINPDGSTPPPVVHVVEVDGDGTIRIQGAGQTTRKPISGAPRKIRPSDLPLPGIDVQGPAVTPLAQMPARSGPTGQQGGVTRLDIPSVPTVSIRGPVASAAPAGRPMMYLGGSGFLRQGGVAYIGTPAAATPVAEGLAYATDRAADALAILAHPDALGAVTRYNFIHFDPALLLNDAIAAFSQESATLSFVPMPNHSTARAWSITAAVIGLDLLLAGYCYRKSQRRKAMAPVAPRIGMTL